MPLDQDYLIMQSSLHITAAIVNLRGWIHFSQFRLVGVDDQRFGFKVEFQFDERLTHWGEWITR